MNNAAINGHHKLLVETPRWGVSVWHFPVENGVPDPDQCHYDVCAPVIQDEEANFYLLFLRLGDQITVGEIITGEGGV
jgi:hypothetical protein